MAKSTKSNDIVVEASEVSKKLSGKLQTLRNHLISLNTEMYKRHMDAADDIIQGILLNYFNIDPNSEDSYYNLLGTTRDELLTQISTILCNSVTSDYSNNLADLICDDVAKDIVASASPEWTEIDLKLAIGRIITQVTGVQS